MNDDGVTMGWNSLIALEKAGKGIYKFYEGAKIEKSR